MSIITISQGSYSQGKEVAELVAKRLGYERLARDVVLQASAEFNIPEVKLVQAIEDPPSIFERFSSGKQRYIAYIRAALLKHFKEDNVVYHGLLGHYFLPGISHVVKVRVLADKDIRIDAVMNRDNASEAVARQTIEASDKARQAWALYLYGIDPGDPEIYNLVVHVGKVAAEYAADMICAIAGLPSFAATDSSRAAMNDLALAAQVEAVLLEQLPDIEVTSKAGKVKVSVTPARIRAGFSSEFHAHYREDLQFRIRDLTKEIAGIERIDVDVPLPD